MIISEDEAASFCKSELGRTVSAADLSQFRQSGILPRFKDGSGYAFLRSDLTQVVSQCTFAPSVSDRGGQNSLFEALNASRMMIGDGTTVDQPEADTSVAYAPAVRNLIEAISENSDAPLFSIMEDARFLSPCRITTNSENVRKMAEVQRRRAEALSMNKGGEFANSAYYMGSKRALTPLIVESISAQMRERGVVLDLMCGSGVVSGACARFWPVIASDSQLFSRCLAVVQGGGFTRTRAVQVLDQVLTRARENLTLLTEQLGDVLDEEDALFHSDIGVELRDAYATFIANCPVLGSNARIKTWDPAREVELRREAPARAPYILCTAYFANVYFGLRQAVEIDSIRFGIDSLDDADARAWALGALVASASKIATSYAGHFAEPRISDWHAVTPRALGAVIEKRVNSVIHEFTVRLLNLADESARIPHAVSTVKGPWEDALRYTELVASGRPVVVYFDPPYRREEYSRYYHVLETLTSYAYPSINGRGRMPNKGPGGRFQSEFFTRALVRKRQALVSVIQSILRHGWTCAWSYSDVADVSIPEVLRQLRAEGSVSTRSVSAQHRHQSHGRGVKDVTEYIIFIRPGAM